MIEFGKYSEEYFLTYISNRYRTFFEKFTHRDTQLRDKEWRIQGTVSIEEFNKFLKEGNKLTCIDSIRIDFENKRKYLITMRVINNIED